MSVATLLSMPRASGLFGRAIMQSGSGSAVLVPQAQIVEVQQAGRRY